MSKSCFVSCARQVWRLAGQHPTVADRIAQMVVKDVLEPKTESILSRQIDDLEPTLTRNGYRLKDLMEQFDAKPAEIKALFSNTLDPAVDVGAAQQYIVGRVANMNYRSHLI